jgi:hypothetical protein
LFKEGWGLIRGVDFGWSGLGQTQKFDQVTDNWNSNGNTNTKCKVMVMVYGVEHHFQQYFSYIVAVSFIGGNQWIHALFIFL